MGGEFGQLREWVETREQDWMLMKYPIHDAFSCYMRQLNEIYQKFDAFWQGEYNSAHFAWLDCESALSCTYAILRKGVASQLIAVFHFSTDPLKNYVLKTPGPGCATLILHSDWQQFGGTVPEKKFKLIADERKKATLDLPAFSAQLFLWESAIS